MEISYTVEALRTKVCQVSGILYRIRDYIPIDCLRQIYLSIVYPHLLYCCAIWGGSNKTQLDSLFISQKKIIRIMSFRHSYEHTNPLFTNLKLLKLNEIIHLQTMLFVYKSLNSCPLNLNFHFVRSHNRHDNLRIPLCRTTHAQQSVMFRGAKLWNELPQQIRSAGSHTSFKTKLKLFLFDKYLYQVE